MNKLYLIPSASLFMFSISAFNVVNGYNKMIDRYLQGMTDNDVINFEHNYAM